MDEDGNGLVLACGNEGCNHGVNLAPMIGKNEHELDHLTRTHAPWRREIDFRIAGAVGVHVVGTGQTDAKCRVEVNSAWGYVSQRKKCNIVDRIDVAVSIEVLHRHAGAIGQCSIRVEDLR